MPKCLIYIAKQSTTPYIRHTHVSLLSVRDNLLQLPSAFLKFAVILHDSAPCIITPGRPTHRSALRSGFQDLIEWHNLQGGEDPVATTVLRSTHPRISGPFVHEVRDLILARARVRNLELPNNSGSPLLCAVSILQHGKGNGAVQPQLDFGFHNLDKTAKMDLTQINASRDIKFCWFPMIHPFM